MNHARPRMAAYLLCLSLLFVTGCADKQVAADPKKNDERSAPAKSLEATGKTFKLAIDYGDGVEKHYPKLAWREGLTVLEAMELTKDHPRGVKFATRNDAKGEAAFVDHIDNVHNEGGGKDARNWTFKINGKKSPVGAGVQKLAENDTVVWKFGVFEIE